MEWERSRSAAENLLNLAAGSTLDVQQGSVIVDYANSTPISTIRNWLTTGSNAGAWNVNGIASNTAAAAGGLTALGYAEARDVVGTTGGTLSGESVDATSVIIMYTYGGDANLDGFVSGDDYSAIDFNIRVSGASSWYNGDFNYDGIISGDDYSIIAFNIIAQGPPIAIVGNAMMESPVVAVPEPTGMVFTIAASLLLRRRRP